MPAVFERILPACLDLKLEGSGLRRILLPFAPRLGEAGPRHHRRGDLFLGGKRKKASKVPGRTGRFPPLPTRHRAPQTRSC